MLLAHKIELRPTPEQVEYLARACGSRRHCFNQLLAHFNQDGVKWSKAAAYQHYIQVLRVEFPWYTDVAARVTRNAIDDLDSAYKHFFRRCKNGEKPGYPGFKKKGLNDSFALRESAKFDVDGRELRLEKLNTRIKMRQRLRFDGKNKQVTISQRAGKFYASILVDTQDYNRHAPQYQAVGVDLGVGRLAVTSDGEEFEANQKLKASLKRMKKRQRWLSRKQKGSNRRAKAKLSLAKLHKRIADQRQAVCHELSDYLTGNYQTICIEDVNVSGMVKNHNLARAINDAGFGMLRSMIQYKAELRGNTVVLVDRWFPSSKTCSECGLINSDVVLGVDAWQCECGAQHDRDLNAAINILNYGRDTLERDLKRTQESSKTLAC